MKEWRWATYGDVNQTELGCRNKLKKEERVETGKKDAALLWKVLHSLNVCFMVTDFRKTFVSKEMPLCQDNDSKSLPLSCLCFEFNER